MERGVRADAQSSDGAGVLGNFRGDENDVERCFFHVFFSVLII